MKLKISLIGLREVWLLGYTILLNTSLAFSRFLRIKFVLLLICISLIVCFAAVVGGTVVGLLTAILLVMFIVYRMRKKDEGSYALEEPKPRPYAILSVDQANHMDVPENFVTALAKQADRAFYVPKRPGVHNNLIL
ncbi:unnamed protein product [Strongylus vulgaris]|uniref:Syndecan n=1 Tax=Strongylus vulgaris TaxID=40348 RepID=A0A3P7IYK7_STRVU|nr:unnamed protein product [Strongylus vulgaris]